MRLEFADTFQASPISCKSGSLRKFGSTLTADTNLSAFVCIKCMGLHYAISLTYFLLAKSR